MADTGLLQVMAHVRHTGSLGIDAPPELAIWLFTGPGEELWIDGWRPTVLSGDGLKTGSVFVTELQEHTIWIVLDFDLQERHARYARVAPGTRAGTVDVRVFAHGPGKSIANVTYELTGLSEEGNVIVREFDATAFKTMMSDWQNAIADVGIDFEQAFGKLRQ